MAAVQILIARWKTVCHRLPRWVLGFGGCICLVAGAVMVLSAFQHSDEGTISYASWGSVESDAVSFIPPEGDMGLLEQDRTVPLRVSLRNGTHRRLIIDHLEATCGCMKPTVANQEVPAGAATEVVVTIKTDRRRGEFRSAVDLRYHLEGDNTSLPLRLPIKGEIRSDFNISPSRLIVRDDQQTWSQTIRIRANRPGVSKITGIETSHRTFKATVTKSSKDEWAVQFRFVPDEHFLPIGEFFLTVATNTTAEPRIEIPIRVDSLRRVDLVSTPLPDPKRESQ